ncbi:MAG: phosphoribosyl-AMP cyclohydrolase [Omnitrophica bacterium RIFCSPLOWO2_12_FULL_44_17]|uniref:Histidine biosynthesis bifunctional protein HisIE n=1 Tax=Candidatus Danuiimicrobium aquiferis TaxID=1801832 RepID=A0A1G1KYL0_9BACT|nr:MAG: phosphoribosyl-AMP cyclohydrolase [Omnitrophica bacterium RIFCSPHIGHO2_02_FULL_45_28]OGW91630.1 MAG: phosphoribosyl-AMP cyclohydrolase [Omnitrophica bacterium RIFCSPHIGHO2_12_FULL_44_12]OGW97990.1 MAG: phosphoribosyl-AMP cyclohydrolase [Omnitrophica bacterium RIFCSPLOWO2_12_FULL_44_17]OGX03566.1 MAG: phosphoribosyl-AMP cyclohydrolase [Omnitrophica bacterium RIFCSPLOWO2_02_FULL_44_11]
MINFKFDEQGLMPAIVQDIKTKEVLMVAYVNEESLKKMLKIKKTCFYSRSRKKFWVKGEESGHIQIVKKVFTDCDRDTLLIQVAQKGGACHLGYKSCFVFPVNEKGNMKPVTAKQLFDPNKVYKKK